MCFKLSSKKGEILAFQHADGSIQPFLDPTGRYYLSAAHTGAPKAKKVRIYGEASKKGYVYTNPHTGYIL